MKRMKTTRASILIGLGALSLCVAGNAAALQVYHWVDERGVAHFSENPPPEKAPDLATIDVETDSGANNLAGDDAYDTEAHAERMDAWREEKRQQREAKQERRRQAARSRPVEVPEYSSGYAGAYWYPFHRYRPPHQRPPVV